MLRATTNLYVLVIIAGTLIGYMMVFMHAGGLLPFLPTWFFKLYISVVGFAFVWWPIDMLIHWDKRTAASIEKDKYIGMAVITFLITFFPWYWLAYPLQYTFAVGATIGFIIPMTVISIKRILARRVEIQPEMVHKIGMQCKGAQEFLRYFPNARKYVIGLSPSESERSHLVMHHRQPHDGIPGSQIDYVMDVAVDRNLGIYVNGKEKLECYFFINEGNKARVGFLPSSNVGRALDYGFSEEEMETANEESISKDQRWPALKDKPILLEHYRGKVIELR